MNRILQQTTFGWVHAGNQQELTANCSYFIENSMQCDFRGSLRTYVQDLIGGGLKHKDYLLFLFHLVLFCFLILLRRATEFQIII
jgi:hypothetical protein